MGMNGSLFLILLLISLSACERRNQRPKSRNKSQLAAAPRALPRMIGTQKSLITELLKEYDVNEWPHHDLGTQTDVRVQLFINSFGSLNAANMDYSIDTFIRQKWNDPRLRYTGGRKFITISDGKVLEQLWKPDTFFENVKEAAVHQLQQYPLDSQVCFLAMASYANTVEAIKYYWGEKNPIQVTEGLSISQFDLLDMHTLEKIYSYDTGNFSGLHVLFSLRRQNGYHILQTYIPTVLIVSISWVSFWLDPNAVPGRVSLGVTTLLTLTTLAAGIRQQLPPVSYVKAIDVWIGVCMIMVFGALLEFTLANWMANRKIPPGVIPCRIPHFLLCFSVTGADDTEGDKASSAPKAAATTYLPHARALDRVCRVMFPGSFLIFNFVYWPYYLYNQYKDPFLYL